MIWLSSDGGGGWALQGIVDLVGAADRGVAVKGKCCQLADWGRDDDGGGLQQGHHGVIKTVAFQLQVLRPVSGAIVSDLAFVKPIVHPQTKACLLAKNQQKKHGDRSGILSEHEPRKYLICNDISKD